LKVKIKVVGLHQQTTKTHQKMATYNKTIELNGKSIKVNVGFQYHRSDVITTSDRTGETWTMPVSVFVNDICYEKAVTSICKMTKKTGRHYVNFVCNKTGVKFNDSEKKVIEHILTLNK
jgi:hypothetical protein